MADDARIYQRERLVRLATLTRILGLYIARVVLAKGALRSRQVRIVVVSCMGVLMVLMASLATFVISSAKGNEYAIDLVFSINSISAVLWTAIAFMITKLLMANSYEMMALSNGLGVTSTERQLAVDSLEILIVAGLALAGFFSFSVASVVAFGAAALLPLTACLFLPSIATFAVLFLSYKMIDLILSRVGVAKNRVSVMIALVFFAVIWVWRETEPLILAIAAPIGPEPFTIWSLVFKDLAARWGGGVLFLCMAVLFLSMVLSFLLIPSAPLEARFRYFDLPFPAWMMGEYGFHLVCAFRSRYTVEAVVLSALFMFFLATSPVGAPTVVWGAEPIVFGGFFHYAMVIPSVRTLVPAVSAFTLYHRILTSQLVVASVVVVPAVVLDLVRGADLRALGLGLLGVTGSALLTICIGIAMPASDDNPISVIIGTFVAVAVVLLIALVTAVISLPSSLTVIVAIGVVGLVVAYSLLSLESHRKACYA